MRTVTIDTRETEGADAPLTWIIEDLRGVRRQEPPEYQMDVCCGSERCAIFITRSEDIQKWIARFDTSGKNALATLFESECRKARENEVPFRFLKADSDEVEIAFTILKWSWSDGSGATYWLSPI